MKWLDRKIEKRVDEYIKKRFDAYLKRNMRNYISDYWIEVELKLARAVRMIECLYLGQEGNLYIIYKGRPHKIVLKSEGQKPSKIVVKKK